MKKILLTVFLGWWMSASIHAQTTPVAPTAAPSIAVTATASVVSQYMLRGLRLNGAGIQPVVEATAGNLTAGVWGNFVLDDKVPDSSDPEADLYGSYTIPLGKNLSIAPGFIWYIFPSAPTDAGFYRSTFEPNLALSYTVEGVKLTPKVYYDMTLKGATYEVTAQYAVPLKELGTELGFTATLGTFLLRDAANDASPRVKSWGDYWLVGVSMPFQLTKDSKVAVGFAFTEGRNAFTKAGTDAKAPNLLAVGRGVVSLAYSLSF